MKEKKKKVLVLALLLLAIAGVAGYGVYSYFWTKGEFSASDNVQVATFDVSFSNGKSEGFISTPASINLSCPNVSGNESVTCTGSARITNNGGTSVVVEILNEDGINESSNNMSGTVYDPEFDWTTATLAPGESKDLDVTVDVTINSNNFDSDTAIESTSGEGDSYGYGGYLNLKARFDIKATQVHN